MGSTLDFDEKVSELGHPREMCRRNNFDALEKDLGKSSKPKQTETLGKGLTMSKYDEDRRKGSESYRNIRTWYTELTGEALMRTRPKRLYLGTPSREADVSQSVGKLDMPSWSLLHSFRKILFDENKWRWSVRNIVDKTRE